jgi:hypothetical protein
MTTWIDEMLANTRVSKASAAALRKRTHLSESSKEKSDQQLSIVKEAWAELLGVMRKDVKDFNTHKSRATHSPALMSTESLSLARFQFEVYVPEMNSRLLVLTLTGNSLQVNVRPKFPEQEAAITLESQKGGTHYCWLLNGTGKEKKEVSAEQLSEYLLRPILFSSEVD